jgi:hypothetical protein
LLISLALSRFKIFVFYFLPVTKLEFETLAQQDKINYACSGKHVDTIQYYGYHVLLYSMDDGSFCEVFFHREENKIIRAAICDDYDLKKFLSQINLQ